MCRSIKPLFNFDPPVTPDEVRANPQVIKAYLGDAKPATERRHG